MTSKEIRRAFLDFFKEKGHLIVPSAPIVAKNDPTLMFNNSGMAQFKDFFLGNENPPSPRIADSQKCLRVSGKHNDLEEVGFDTYHHTMFEMLGNWSFGDYFKKEAIHWAWELLTEVYKLPKDRIYVSVFGGDQKDNVPFDQEAYDIWFEIVKDENRIIHGNKKDNFWEMGDVGPCGPCSEIHIDLREQSEVDKISGKDLVNQDHPQVIEIWNLVFMQFERKADSSLIPLPEKHVDTGMGFERLCMAIQGKKSNYDTDVFQNTIAVIEKLSGKKYGVNGTLSNDSYVDVAMRVIADHIRAVSFTIADGQLPSNAKAGYVVRRILRRAVRYGFSYLGFREPFMCKLVPVLAEQFAEVFPELQAQTEFVSKVIEEEEKSFQRTLDHGLKRLDAIFSGDNESKILSGNTVFELSDTFGFPVDLTALIAREKGFSIDEEGYKKALEEQKNRSRKDAEKEASDWIELGDTDGVEFLGYELTASPATLTKYRINKTKKGQEVHLVLDQTPFYAEMGGQVGDTGTISFELGGQKYALRVEDTKKENDLFIHIVTDKRAVELLSKIHEPLEVIAEIDTNRRGDIAKNHSATHLMLAALRKVLGNHIIQRGSFQNDEVTRFDFSHFAKVTDEELKQVEDIVNEKIRANIAVETRVNVPFDDALKLGATATFGEKYGDFVRVVLIDPEYSIELCGGTHVKATGEIGLFKFISEGSVSAGVRRVEALTGVKAMELLREQSDLILELKELLKSNDIRKGVEQLKNDNQQLAKKIESYENAQVQAIKIRLVSKAQKAKGMDIVAERVDLPTADGLKQLAFGLKQHLGKPVVILGGVVGGKPNLCILIDENVVKERNLNAGQIIREVSKLMKGGGGGQPHFATAGGSDIKGLDDAIEAAKEAVLK